MLYQFYGFEVDTVVGLLTRKGKILHLRPRAFKFLCCLLEKQNQVVSKEDLVDAVWDGRPTSEAAISSCLKAVRESLTNDKTEQKKIVRTIHGRGFLISCESKDENQLKTSATNHSGIAVDDYLPRLAILPFKVANDGESCRLICQGLEEEIYTSVCRTKSFFVYSRPTVASVFDNAIATQKMLSKINVTYVLEGVVTESDNQFRLNTTLTNCEEGVCIWADSYMGVVAELFRIQDEISKKIINSIYPEVQRSEYAKTTKKQLIDLNAYDNYLKALPLIWRVNKCSNVEAVKLLDKACEIDPNYSLARAMKAWCFAQIVIYAWCDSQERASYKERANDIAHTALMAEPSNPTILTIYGTAMCLVGNMEVARESLTRAIDIDPSSNWAWNRLGWIEGYQCNKEASISCFEKALDLSPYDPMNFNCYFGLAQAYFINKEYSESLKWIERALSIRSDAVFIHRLKAACCFYTGATDEARESVKKILNENKKITASEIGSLVPFNNEEVLDRLVEGIVQAGLAKV